MQDAHRLTARILCATDFSVESERAFYHALAFAVARRARLTLLHTGPESRKNVAWDKYPGVRETLVGWGLLPADAAKEVLAEQLGLGIKKMAIRDDSPREGIVDFLRKRPTDLLVMATEGRSGLARLRRGSIAESVYELTHSHTLLLPQGCRNLVDSETGRPTIERVLFLIEADPDPLPSLGTLVEWLPSLAGEKPIEVLVLYTGSEEFRPNIMYPTDKRLNWKQLDRRGNRQNAILDCIDEFDVDLVCLTTEPDRGLFNRLRGSLVDRLIRQAGRAILALPAAEYRRPHAPRFE